MERMSIVIVLALIFHIGRTLQISENKTYFRSPTISYVNFTGVGLTRSSEDLTPLECNNNIQGIPGTGYSFQAPSFPGETRGGDECNWFMRIPPNTKVEVAFFYFNLLCEEGHSVKITFGETQEICPQISTADGTSIVADFINFRSFERLLIIRYRSNIGSTRREGFVGQIYLSSTTIRPSRSPSLCGSQLTKKVVDGITSSPEEFPWQVYLLMRSGDDYSSCGGTLIADQWVMTAAHCVVDSWLTYIFIGCDTTDDFDTCDQIYAVFDRRSIIIHEEYTGNLFDGNDIALLRLSTAVVLNDRARLVCLPSLPRPETLALIDVAGWGQTCEDCSGSPILKTATMQILDWTDCQMGWTPDDVSALSEKILCTAPGAGQVYFGDSGGFGGWRRDDGRYEQLGVVSFGPQVPYDNERPIAFTRVYDYMIWLFKTMLNFEK